MKIIVDFELCESNAICVDVAPEIFHINDEDELEILLEAPGERLRSRVEESVRLCPRQAISVEE
jgi:ferredoxin|tara:strand:+ start:1061 stop:1252 length:192 start_codon:yes stop_codon:yes gene_type:complete